MERGKKVEAYVPGGALTEKIAAQGDQAGKKPLQTTRNSCERVKRRQASKKASTPKNLEQQKSLQIPQRKKRHQLVP